MSRPFSGLSAHSVSHVASLLSLFIEFIIPPSFFSTSRRKLGGGEIFLVRGRGSPTPHRMQFPVAWVCDILHPWGYFLLAQKSMWLGELTPEGRSFIPASFLLQRREASRKCGRVGFLSGVGPLWPSFPSPTGGCELHLDTCRAGMCVPGHVCTFAHE